MPTKARTPRPIDPDGSSSADPVRTYLQQVGRVPLLTREGEVELARRRDRALAIVRGLTLRSADAAPVIDMLAQRGGERVTQLYLSCRSHIDGGGWAAATACIEELGELLGGVPEQTPRVDALAVVFEATLGEALALPDTVDARELGELERRLGWPRASWTSMRDAIIEARREARCARAELVEANLRLVVAVARRYARQGQPLLDLIQEGNLGLMRAAEKFDASRGFRFSTYAIWWIRQSVTRSLADQARTIRLPVHIVESLHKLNRARREYLAVHDHEPDAEQLAEQLELPIARVHHLLTLGADPASLDASIGEDSELRDVIEDVNAPDPIEQIAEVERADHLERLLGGLSERERHVLRLRFGLEDGSERTLELVGREFSLTRERVRQIEAKALQKLLRPSLEAKLGERPPRS